MDKVEKIILKHFKPKKKSIVLGWNQCKRELEELKRAEIIKVTQKTNYRLHTPKQQLVMREKARVKIEESINYYFSKGNVYDWINGNDNLKKLIE